MLRQLFSCIALLFYLLFSQLAAAAPTAPNDQLALAGLQTGKAVFDVTTKDPARLLFTVKVIEETWEGMKSQGVTPDFVISFRGGSLPLLRAHPESMSERDEALLREVRERLNGMQDHLTRKEACNVAGRLFKVTPDQLASGIHMVGNSLISLIGYQNKGYAIVPMN